MKQILILCLIVFSKYSFSQEIKIRGTIKEADNNQPVPGASITIKNKRIGTISDKDGNFALTISSGSLPINIIISAMGYEEKELSVDNESGALIIMLQARSELLNEVVTAASRVPESILRSP